MPQVKKILKGVGLLGLLLLGAVTGCNEHTDVNSGRGMVDVPRAASPVVPFEGWHTSSVEELDSSDPMDADQDVSIGTAPCSESSAASCAPRDVSRINLFTTILHPGAAYSDDLSAHSVEDVLEKGLQLGELSPVHLVVRGTTVANSTRCEWRGVARTAAQREAAIRFWLGIADSDSLPSAAEAERRFMAKLGQLSLAIPQTAKTSFRALAQGGLTTEYLFLTCYVDYSASEYLLGAGPTTLTVAYDHMAQTRSYALYQRAHAVGEFGSATLLTESAYQALLDQALWDTEAALRKIVEGRQSVVFLAPMGAHHAIAIEAWQVVAQWDVQTVNGTVNVVRYGTHAGDPEHYQTLAKLKSRDHNGGGQRRLCHQAHRQCQRLAEVLPRHWGVRRHHAGRWGDGDVHAGPAAAGAAVHERHGGAGPGEQPGLGARLPANLCR